VNADVGLGALVAHHLLSCMHSCVFIQRN
jgi:hypothetical protein